MSIVKRTRWAWKIVKRSWLNPKRAERVLREQGLQANPYQLWVGDLMKMVKMQEKAKSIPLMTHSHDLAPHVIAFVHHIVKQYGLRSLTFSFFDYKNINCVRYYGKIMHKPNFRIWWALLFDFLHIDSSLFENC